jgi:tRNA nucleotidyltransferase (CCA-adding enzyme)
MDLILCHTTADFDTIGAAVGLARLLPGSKIVLSGGAHPVVKDFLALYRDEYPSIERRAVIPATIRSLNIVDTQQRQRLGKAAEWLDLPDLQSIVVYDHHLGQDGDIPATALKIEPVGATTTIVVEQLQQADIALTTAEATIMALGIHVDTGSLTFAMSTVRDALALGWLMQQGANLAVIKQYVDPGLSPQLQQLLQVALKNIQYLAVGGKTIGWVVLRTEHFVPGLSSAISQIQLIVADLDVLLLAHAFPDKGGEQRVAIIGRSQIPSVDLQGLFRLIGGGGHAQAASASLRGVEAEVVLSQLVATIAAAIPQPITAKDLMSAPIRTIRPETTIAAAQRMLLRYGHSGLPIVVSADPPSNNQPDILAGIISRRDLDIALHHGFSHAPVKGYMTTKVRTITPDTTLPEIETLMVTYDIGRLPVVVAGKLVGIVTRTDVLRELHQHRNSETTPIPVPSIATFTTNSPLAIEAVGSSPLQAEDWGGVNQNNQARFKLPQLQQQLVPQLWELLMKAAQIAAQYGWHLYLVGGAVRDLLLADSTVATLAMTDIDLVVDGFHQAADVGAGVKLAAALQALYPSARLDIHGAFQTAALLWHQDPEIGSLGIDIATARTEFYPYPAANPEVEASSIRQDLYRRDFTINAMALRLTPAATMPLLDFFGGWGDLQAKQIRVLHPNSFIEDPTRIYRGVRFAVRLGFELESQTAAYIRYAIDSGIFDRTAQANPKTPALQTRLKTELKYLLQVKYWQPALELLADLGALQCLHSSLKLDSELLHQLRLLERCLQRFDPLQQLIHWQLRLETIIAQLDPEYRPLVAQNLQLPGDSIDRLQNLDRSQTELMASLPSFELVSQSVKMLRQHDLQMLILIAIRCQNLPIIRRQIWQYLTVWRHIQPILNGDDLRQLGYKPGPQYRQILDDLLAATLDGAVTDRSTAKEFVRSTFP